VLSLAVVNQFSRKRNGGGGGERGLVCEVYACVYGESRPSRNTGSESDVHTYSRRVKRERESERESKMSERESERSERESKRNEREANPYLEHLHPSKAFLYILPFHTHSNPSPPY
jgi:hypothetical protein